MRELSESRGWAGGAALGFGNEIRIPRIGEKGRNWEERLTKASPG